ncbi:MAG: aminopeptidase, partial [Candidatus Aenigmatarchaeota archaeon]
AYWDQIIRACHLREADPKAKWREIQKEIFRLRDRLNTLKIEKVHIEAQGTDLTLGIGKNRQWVGGPGYNLPSFEVYISPDCRIADGHVSFNRPLYRYGNLISEIRLELKGGKIVKATAKKGQKMLKELIATQGADRLGEFSLTDGRLSPITKFMADTLYDENAGGKFGNMHIAIGKAIKDTYPGDPKKVPKAKWAKMGYNDSAVHADIVNTERKTVTATLEGGSKKVIYKDGRFLV